MHLWNHDHVHGLSQAKGGMNTDAIHWFCSSEDTQYSPPDHKWFGYFSLKYVEKEEQAEDYSYYLLQLLPSHKTRLTGLLSGVTGG